MATPGARDRVTERNVQAQHCMANWLVLALGLLLAAAPLFSGCANFGSPPATLGGFEPYRVSGRTYVPLKKWESYQEIGVASWYGGKFNGRTTANGERFDAGRSFTAAHRTLPFNVCAAVRAPPDRPLGVRADQRPRPVQARSRDRPLARGRERARRARRRPRARARLRGGHRGRRRNLPRCVLTLGSAPAFRGSFTHSVSG